jgi:hypothetical protein
LLSGGGGMVDGLDDFHDDVNQPARLSDRLKFRRKKMDYLWIIVVNIWRIAGRM